MKQTIFVISDLHLGGEPASDKSPGFQMCSLVGRQRLAQFLDWALTLKSAEQDVHLIIAGDIVDFLAEKDSYKAFSAFTADQKVAKEKFINIVRNTPEVWDGLKKLVGQGCALTMMLGNHDIELSLPDVRRELLKTVGTGRVEFLCDNEAFTLGDLLIEHGNRYDGFNVVAYDSLRRLRSLLSRRDEHPPIFPAQPGSQLVETVMNPLKEKFAFVDLLKPETSAVLPILAALDPAAWRSIGSAIYDAAHAAWHQSQYDADGQPTRSDFVAGTKLDTVVAQDTGSKTSATESTVGQATVQAQGDGPAFPDNEHFALADEIVKEYRLPETTSISGDGLIKDLLARVRAAVDGLRTDLLYKALRAWARDDSKTFDIEEESSVYLKPATTLAGRGFRFIINGHTHLAKRKRISEQATYLNTGTWADLIRIPRAIFDSDEDQGQNALKQFLDDLRENRLERLRRSVPTFARIEVEIEVEEDRVLAADIHFFDGAGKTPSLTTQGLLDRLGS